MSAKQGNMNSDTDMNSVTVIGRAAPKRTTLRSQADINAAKARGLQVDTNRKMGGSNSQHGTSKNAARLDNETEELKHDTLGMDVGKIIAKARNDKEWTQKELAQKINEKPQVINEYEQGKVVPNQQILGKMERCLGVRLRGKDKGKPFDKKSK